MTVLVAWVGLTSEFAAAFALDTVSSMNSTRTRRTTTSDECPPQRVTNQGRRVVTDITREPDVELLVDSYAPKQFSSSPPFPEMSDPAKLTALCKKGYRFCPKPLRGQADHDWYTCETRRFVARVKCGTIDPPMPIPGMVYDNTRTFPVHGCHPKGYQPSRPNTVRSFKKLAHNLAVYPDAFAHVLNHLPRLILLLEHIPRDVPVLLTKSSARDQLVKILEKKGVLDSQRVVDWDPKAKTAFRADEVYFAGEMGKGRRHGWDMLRQEKCSWAMVMARQKVQELFTAGTPKPFHAALPGNLSTASVSTGAVVPLWSPSDPTPPCRVLVVHRKDAKGGRRMVKNHDQMLQALQQAFPQCSVTGFVGSEYPLEEQIGAFTSADVVVAPHGAALAFVSFMRPGSAVVEIGYTSDGGMKFPAPYYMILAITVNVRYYLSMAEGGYFSPMTADVADVVEMTRRALSL